MRYRILALLLIAALLLPISAYAAPIKPVADPWDDPENLEVDGESYSASGGDGYVVIWETPECDVDGAHLIVENGVELVVDYKITYMDSVPWGHVSVELDPDEDGRPESFAGWVLMADLVDLRGEPAAVRQPAIPAHPMIPNSTEPQETPQPTPSAQQIPSRPQKPAEAITIGNTYNNVIIYTSLGIAVLALVLVLGVIIRHKALNKKGE